MHRPGGFSIVQAVVVAPVRIPVEISRPGQPGAGRWFRLAVGIAEGGLLFPRALPAELGGPLQLRFQLPPGAAFDASAPNEDGGGPALTCGGRIVDLPAEEGEEARRRAVRFLDLDEADRDRIARYIEERVPA